MRFLTVTNNCICTFKQLRANCIDFAHLAIQITANVIPEGLLTNLFKIKTSKIRRIKKKVRIIYYFLQILLNLA